MFFTTLYFALVSASVTFQPAAMTYHALIGNDELQTIKERGHTLDEGGRLTFHTGAGVSFRWDYFQLTTMYFRNSFDQHSGTLMGGPKFNFGKYFSLGLVVGGYARKYIAGMKIPFSYHNESVEIAPMAMVTSSVAIKIYRSLFFEVGAGSNYVLNFFTPGIRMDF